MLGDDRFKLRFEVVPELDHIQVRVVHTGYFVGDVYAGFFQAGPVSFGVKKELTLKLRRSMRSDTGVDDHSIMVADSRDD